MTTTPVEAQRRYDTLTKRIAALDADIAGALDNESRAIYQEKRDALIGERDAITSQPQGKANGDLAELNRKAAELASALTSDSPSEAHRIILDCVAALERLDHRVSHIERRINPPWQVTFWRVMAVLILLFGLSIDVLRLAVILAEPVLGAALNGMTLVLVATCLLLADAHLEHAQRRR